MLPRFIAIGAMKCATTTLYNLLVGHPDVYLHPHKEIGFFTWPDENRTRESYEAYFEKAPAGAVCGEVSTMYAKYPRFDGVPARIQALIPDARLLYLVRHPIRRIVSHYHHESLRTERMPPIDQAVRENPHFVAFSQYHMQLQRYLPYFDREQILVVVVEEWMGDRERGLARIIEHIGCDPSRGTGSTAWHSNVTAERVRVSRSIRAIRSLRAYRRVRFLIPQRWRDAVVHTLGHAPPPRPVPTPETLAWLRTKTREDARSLATYLGRSGAIWDLEDV